MNILSIFLSLCSITLILAHPTTDQHHPKSLHRRKFDGNLMGLCPLNLQRNGISIGFLPALGESVAPNTPKEINAKLPAPMAIMGDYINLESDGPNHSQMDSHFKYIQSLDGNPVWQIALMPYKGLEGVTPEVADIVAKKMRWINEQGIIVWLRFAHEMNGDWYKWGSQPKLFIEKWKLMFDAVKSQTDNTYLMWAPNSKFGHVDATHGGYNPYWPGAAYVDIIGLSFYHYGGMDRLNTAPEPGEALKTMKYFADLFSTPNGNKPFVLAETGASYTRSKETGEAASGGASDYDIKYGWIRQLLSKEMAEAIPSLKAISWFEVMKYENAAGNTPIKSEDFRLFMGDGMIGKDSASFVASSDF
ncbi:glycoside hydrolase superfamily [Melampsora americana]|nr:glycoside hydrolase superfamily [Melampsora americana]